MNNALTKVCQLSHTSIEDSPRRCMRCLSTVHTQAAQLGVLGRRSQRDEVPDCICQETMIEEDKDFECFKKFKEWIQAEKAAGDQTKAYQDYQKFRSASELQESGK